MAVKHIDVAYQTMFSELEQRCLDAEFDDAFPEAGAFKKTKVKEREYWYFVEKNGDRYRKRYVGPVADDEITKRVENFRLIKNDYRSRKRIVSTLVNDAHLPGAPTAITGDFRRQARRLMA